ILTNREVIAVNQDKDGKQGRRVSQNGDTQIWARPLSSNAMAVGLFNLSSDEARMTVKWADLKIKGRPRLRDLWQHKDVSADGDGYSATVPAHGVVMLRVGP